jgi:hypothetical protein
MSNIRAKKKEARFYAKCAAAVSARAAVDSLEMLMGSIAVF